MRIPPWAKSATLEDASRAKGSGRVVCPRLCFGLGLAKNEDEEGTGDRLGRRGWVTGEGFGWFCFLKEALHVNI